MLTYNNYRRESLTSEISTHELAHQSEAMWQIINRDILGYLSTYFICQAILVRRIIALY